VTPTPEPGTEKAPGNGTPGPIDWAALAVAAVRTHLGTPDDGLDPAEAARRLAEHGPNRLPVAPGRPAWRRLLAQFDNLLIYVLLAAAVLAGTFGHAVDAAVILAVVLANAIIGYVQEGRAEDALTSIRSMIDPEATVLRGGERFAVAAEAIVPGDLVLLEAGDRVPADLRLVRTRNLAIDEAALTGESVPVEKSVEPTAAGAVLGERRSMAFSGTLVTAGQGQGLVVATGSRSELGRISAMIGRVEELKTPLLRQMDQFARRVTFVVLAVSGLVFVLALLRQMLALDEAFMVVVGLFVAAIPEGLPAVMTITLAIGVQRMAARHAIIRRLPAVETLGAVSVICSDKTGTLTRNEMTVRSVVTAEGMVEVAGSGYVPEGAFWQDGAAFDPGTSPTLQALAESGLLCNDADLLRRDGGWQMTGDPMEGALLAFAIKAGLDPATHRRRLRRQDAIPFDAAHRFMATLHVEGAGDPRRVLVKGAPERLLEMCGTVLTATGTEPLDHAAWQQRIAELAERGERVLAFACKPWHEGDGIDHADLDDGLVLIGLAGFIDPPRDEAIAAVESCHAAGIRVVMITGDHALTARSIARRLGLAENPVVLTGRDLDAMDDAALGRAALETHVFARTTPEHKLRLVQALQAAGLTVAMTGDGVNDAPALKRADVGVAMGRKGTAAARDASEMVLADDNFASIVDAVREGRTVYDNLTKVIAWTLPTNGGEALTIIVAVLAGLALPITPVQILWVNMVTALALGLTLAFEPTEPGTMARPPRPAGEPLLERDVVWRVFSVSVLFVIGAYGVFYWSISRGLPIEAARTLVVNAIVAMEIFYLFSVRYVHGASLSWRGMLGTRAVLIGVATVTVLQVAFTYAPWLQLAFDTRALAVADGLVAVAVGVALFVVVEVEKIVRSRACGAMRHGN